MPSRTRPASKSASDATDVGPMRSDERAVTYTVWYNGRVRMADAKEILAGIQKAARASKELRAMSVTTYAKALIDDAPFFLPKALLAHFEPRTFVSPFDQALEYLAAMPTSGIRILRRG